MLGELSLLGLIAGPALLYLGFNNWHLKRLIENTPTSKIRSIAMGLVEIYGTVSQPLKEFLKTPFTNQHAAHYYYKIEKLQKTKNGSHWTTIKKGQASTQFYLKDNTGSVLVDPTEATIDILPTYQKTTSQLTTLPPAIQQFCAANNVSLNTFFGFGRTLRFSEYALAHNDKAYILGTAGDNPYKAEATAQQNTEDIMIQKGNHGVFYIYNQPEKTILQWITIKAYGGVYGGTITFLASLGYTLWAFGL